MIDQNTALDYYIDEAIKKGLRVDDYSEWVNERGFEFASLGEEGRPYFHKISSTSAKYDPQQADLKFSDLVKNHNGARKIESFFHYCVHDLSIKPYTNGTTFNKSPGKPVIHKKKDDTEKWLYNVKEVLNAPRQETIWSFITKGVNNAIVASSEAGKSTLLLNLAVCIADESPKFLEWPLNAAKARTIYVSTEDGVSQLKARLKTILADQVIPEDSILFIMDSRDLVNRLDETLQKFPSELVIIDTWGDLVMGKYDAEFTRKTMQEIRNVCTKHDATPVYAHHTNKASENIPDKSSVKGAGDFEQACRVVLMLSIYQDKRWLCCVKGNPFPDDYKNTTYELSFDLESGTLNRTGNEMSRHEIIKALRSENLGRPGTEIDFHSILDGEHMSSTNLANKIMENYNISIATAKRKISDAHSNSSLKKDSNGLYFTF
jgi:hypothetical protein